MAKIWAEADLHSVAQTDMRDRIGKILLGRPVIYPSSNPAPDPSPFRLGQGTPEKFLAALNSAGIRIEGLAENSNESI